MSLPSESLTPTPGGMLAGQLHELRAKWGWFVALGALMVVAGFIALGNLVLSTVATVLYIGVMMVLAGGAQIFHAFQVKTWGAFAFWLLDGLLFFVAGLIAIFVPMVAAEMLTLLLGVSLIVGGLFRLVAAFQLRPADGWGWIAFSAAIAVLLGIEIIVGWPMSGLWVLGMLLGIDLIFNGIAILMLGFKLKK